MAGAVEAGVSPPVFAGALWLIAWGPVRHHPLPLGMTLIPAKVRIHGGRRSSPQFRSDLPYYVW
jgi:hypothetical protein